MGLLLSENAVETFTSMMVYNIWASQHQKLPMNTFVDVKMFINALGFIKNEFMQFRNSSWYYCIIIVNIFLLFNLLSLSYYCTAFLFFYFLYMHSAVYSWAGISWTHEYRYTNVQMFGVSKISEWFWKSLTLTRMFFLNINLMHPCWIIKWIGSFLRSNSCY